MANVQKEINYPYITPGSGNKTKEYSIEPGKSKVTSQNKRQGTQPPLSNKKRGGPYVSKTEKPSTETDQDRVEYLRDRYGIDVQPDQLSPQNQQPSLKKTRHTSVRNTTSKQPQTNQQRPVRERPQRIRIKRKSQKSSSNAVKKTMAIFTGIMLTSVAFFFYVPHLTLAMISTVALGMLGAAAATIEWVASLLPETLLEWLTTLAGAVGRLFDIESLNPVNLFFLIYFLHFIWGILVVTIIIILAFIRRVNPIGGKWYAFKVTLIFFSILMHTIPVANLFVIVPLLIWIWLTVLTK